MMIVLQCCNALVCTVEVDNCLFIRQPGSVTAEAITRRSLIGSVEDDPFESAHYGSKGKKNDKARGIIALHVFFLLIIFYNACDK